MDKDQEHYEKVDLPFYKENIEPRIPGEILDFHVHLWKMELWKIDPYKENKKGSKYIVTNEDYTFKDLERDTSKIFLGKKYKAVCFGNPTPAIDLDKTNKYISEGSFSRSNIYPLMIAGKGLLSGEQLEREVIENRFLGYKVFMNWFGNDYGNITVEDMIGPVEMKIADKYNLIVLLHVPQSDRLADPVVQKGIRNLSTTYPNANIVLAHCGRCYLPDKMKRAVSAIKDLDNVYLDTAMVMDPTSLGILLEQIDIKRLVFGTDLPIPVMRGRRVYAMDHWIDVVLEGYPESGYRIQSNNIRATFMVYEIILAIIRACELLKISKEEIRSIFHDNGMEIINKISIP